MEDRIVKKLMTSVKCSKCGQNYLASDVKVLGNHEDLWFLQVTCSSCCSRYIITAVINKDNNPEFVSDLTDTELARFKNTPSLSADDILDMHSFLKKFDGDFSKLLGYKKV
jgi:hypothetical protein